MSGAIAVFVKTPGLSPVKTRLAAGFGKKQAEVFHLTAAQAVASVTKELALVADIDCYYAVAEQDAISHSYWSDLTCLWQGEGGLGARMAHIYQTLLRKHDFVILVGADIPQMTSTELVQATDWLQRVEVNRVVFAPSYDGGFWLFGGNCSIPRTIWTETQYSQADTGVNFFNQIKILGATKILACLRDVDEMEDIPPLRSTLLNLASPTVAQKELLIFLDNLPGFSYA